MSVLTTVRYESGFSFAMIFFYGILRLFLKIVFMTQIPFPAIMKAWEINKSLMSKT